MNKKSKYRFEVADYDIGISKVILVSFVVIIFSLTSCNDTRPKTQITEEEIIVKTPYVSPYRSECDSIQQNTIVSLTFMGISLGEKLNPNLCSSIPCSNLKIYEFEDMATYVFNSKLKIEGKNINTECTIHCLNGVVGEIIISIEQNIFTQIKDLYKEKYGNCFYRYFKDRNQRAELEYFGYKFKNQNIDIEYRGDRRLLWHHELKKHIDTKRYDFKYIKLVYTDFETKNNFNRKYPKVRLDSVNAQREKEKLKEIEIKEQERKQREREQESKQI